MNRTGKVLFILSLFIAIIATMLNLGTVQPAQADDGRINKYPWVNGWGAVAVYCKNAQNNPASSYEQGGSIQVLDASGNLLAKFPDTAIIPKRLESDTKSVTLTVGTDGLYTLETLPAGYFRLTSVADKEGKTFIGKWYGCVPDNINEATPESTALPVCAIDYVQGGFYKDQEFVDGTCTCPDYSYVYGIEPGEPLTLVCTLDVPA